MSRILSTGEGGVCLSACWDTHTPGRHPRADTPYPMHAGIHRHLPSACWDTPPCPVHAGIHPPPPPDRHGYCCERYASYWNAFLFLPFILAEGLLPLIDRMFLILCFFLVTTHRRYFSKERQMWKIGDQTTIRKVDLLNGDNCGKK